MLRPDLTTRPKPARPQQPQQPQQHQQHQKKRDVVGVVGVSGVAPTGREKCIKKNVGAGHGGAWRDAAGRGGAAGHNGSVAILAQEPCSVAE